jgi:hypothetical protein
MRIFEIADHCRWIEPYFDMPAPIQFDQTTRLKVPPATAARFEHDQFAERTFGVSRSTSLGALETFFSRAKRRSPSFPSKKPRIDGSLRRKEGDAGEESTFARNQEAIIGLNLNCKYKQGWIVTFLSYNRVIPALSSNEGQCDESEREERVPRLFRLFFLLDFGGEIGGECSILRRYLRLSRSDRRVGMMDELDLLESGSLVFRQFGFEDRFGRFLLF